MLRLFLILIILVFASAADIKTMEIPDPCFVLIMIAGGKFYWKPALFCLAVYIVILLISLLIKASVPIGFGDVKILAALAMAMGFKSLIYIFACASLLSGTYALIKIIVCKIQKEEIKKELPFMPFITGGFIIAEVLSFL